MVLVVSGTAPAQAEEFRPKPETYICPNASVLGVDCFLDAVEHLYTMCRHVKSIEILEFGYEHADEGVNGAKSEYCLVKHRASITKPFQAALREARASRAAVDGLKALHELWLNALVELKWKPPETDEEYKGRVGQPYEAFREQATVVRTALAELKQPAPARPAKRSADAAAKRAKPAAQAAR